MTYSFLHREYGSRAADVERCARRRFGKQCPKWANLTKMRSVYALSQQLTREGGVPYQVDHIVPMQGIDNEGNHVVSGLHTIDNIRVITASRNASKGDLFLVE